MIMERILKARAKTLMRIGYKPSSIAKELGVSVEKICEWFKMEVPKE